MNTQLYVTLVAAGATLAALYAAAGWTRRKTIQARSLVRLYRERRKPRAAVPMLYIDAQDPWPRREALKALARGLLR